jgi:DNA-binding protein HU-beta
MNKAELIDAVQESLGEECSKAHAERVVNVVLSAVSKGLQKDGLVQLVGFGTFQVKDRKARQGRNPQTNEPMLIPASRSIGFRPGQKLKEHIVETSA